MSIVKVNKNENSLYNKFIAHKAVMKQKEQENNDILSKPPMRYLAYSNEIGAAISPINKTLGTILWAPALLYLGADIYDKYKNEDNTYNPSKKRSLRQAIFQGLTSVILPTVAIELGQKIGVRISTGKESLSAIDKKELVEFTANHLESSVFPKEEGKTYAEELVNAFKQKAVDSKIKVENRSLVEKVFSVFKESDGCNGAITKYLKDETKQNTIIEYLKAQGETIDQIMTSEKNIHADKYRNFYSKMFKKYNNGQVAKLETVNKWLKDKTVNKSLVATASGFIALFLLIKPIDLFAEKVLMEKIVDPILEKFPVKKDKSEANK